MTAVRGLLLRVTSPEIGRLPLLVGAFTLAVALCAAIAAVNWTLLALAGLAAVVVLGLILFRLDFAVAVLTATFFFNAYLNHGAGIVTIDKVLGALAVMAWILEWTVNRRPVLGTRQLWLIGAFLLWTGISIVVARNDRAPCHLAPVPDVCHPLFPRAPDGPGRQAPSRRPGQRDDRRRRGG
jgi:hypothetical protein